MPSTPRSKGPRTTSFKLLITTVSLTTTLGGWALFSLHPVDAPALAAELDQKAATIQPTRVPTLLAEPTKARAVLIIPPLSSLPVRGLRQVGDPTPLPPVAAQVINPPSHKKERPDREQNAPKQQDAPKPQPPAPQPQPDTKTKGSH